MKRVVIGIIRNDHDKILMGKRNDTDKWTVPAGHLEDGECPFLGMTRELKEETDLDAKSVTLVKTVLENGLLIYLFEIKIDSNQEVDCSNDPDKECETFTFEDPFDHIENMHVPVEKNWAIKYWANN